MIATKSHECHYTLCQSGTQPYVKLAGLAVISIFGGYRNKTFCFKGPSTTLGLAWVKLMMAHLTMHFPRTSTKAKRRRKSITKQGIVWNQVCSGPFSITLSGPSRPRSSLSVSTNFPISEFFYFVIRFINHIFFVITFSYFVIRFYYRAIK